MSAEPMSLWTDDITRAGDHAAEEWKDAVRRAITGLPSGREFTTDFVWSALHLLAVTTHEPRAMGAMLRELGRDGVIRNTGRYVKTARVEAHQRPIPVWVRV